MSFFTLSPRRSQDTKNSQDTHSEDYGTPRECSQSEDMYQTPRGQTPKIVIEDALLRNAIDQDKIACCGVSATVECAKSIYRRLLNLLLNTGVNCSSFIMIFASWYIGNRFINNSS